MRNGIISYRVAFTQAKKSLPPARLINNVLNAKWYHTSLAPLRGRGTMPVANSSDSAGTEACC